MKLEISREPVMEPERLREPVIEPERSREHVMEPEENLKVQYFHNGS